MTKKAVPTDEQILIEALPKDEEIRREYDRLMRLFGGAEPAAVALHRKTIARAAFLSITVDRLERDIANSGYKEVYNHGGGQSGCKKSVAADLLPNYTKLFLSCMKQLQDALVPAGNEEPDELERFLSGETFDVYLARWKEDPTADIPAWARRKIEMMDEFDRF